MGYNKIGHYLFHFLSSYSIYLFKIQIIKHENISFNSFFLFTYFVQFYSILFYSISSISTHQNNENTGKMARIASFSQYQRRVVGFKDEPNLTKRYI